MTQHTGSMLSRLLVRMLLPAGLMIILASVVSAAAGANAVPTTSSDAHHSGIGANDVKPGVCGPLNLSNVGSSTGNDLLLGSSGADSLNGGDGSDCISGGDGDDTLTGGAGDDILVGGAGTDTCTGGGGSNTYIDCEVEQ